MSFFHLASQSFVLWRIFSMHRRQISLTQQFSSFCKVLFTSLTQSNFSCTKHYLWWNLRTWVECGIKFVQLQLDTHFLFNNEPLNQLCVNTSLITEPSSAYTRSNPTWGCDNLSDRLECACQRIVITEHIDTFTLMHVNNTCSDASKNPLLSWLLSQSHYWSIIINDASKSTLL